MIASGINLVMTVIGFAVSTMFIVFVCTRLICARIQLSSSRRRAFPAATAVRSHHFSILERRLHGLEPVVVSNFPTKCFGDKFFSFDEDTQCTICLSDYQEKDILRILPYCGHAFHVPCIDIWLQQHSTCPVCRISLRDSPERKWLMHPMYSQPIRSPSLPTNFSSEHHLYTDHGYTSRTANLRQESVQEDHPEASGAGEAASALAEVSITVKDGCGQEAGHKHVERPSNL